MKISLTFTLTLPLLFYVSHLFSHPENNSKVLFEKPFINSMEQEAYVLGLKLSPNSIAVVEDFIGNPSNQTLLKLRHPSKRDKYAIRILDEDENDPLKLR